MYLKQRRNVSQMRRHFKGVPVARGGDSEWLSEFNKTVNYVDNGGQ